VDKISIHNFCLVVLPLIVVVASSIFFIFFFFRGLDQRCEVLSISKEPSIPSSSSSSAV